MPSKSEEQRKMIFAKRSQYGSKANTPEDWKWIWEGDWSKVEEDKKIKYDRENNPSLLQKDKTNHFKKMKRRNNEPLPKGKYIWDEIKNIAIWVPEKEENNIRKRYQKFFPEAKTVDGYESPEPGDLPEKGADMLAKVYASARKSGDDKETAAKKAWSSVRNAGYK